MFEQILRIFAGLFIGVWIARHLGPSDFGELSFALALSSLIGIFASLGLNRTVVRELTLHASDMFFIRRIVAATIVWRLFFSCFCYGLTVSISLIFDQGNPLIVGIVAATITFASFDVIDLYFQSRSASRYSVIARSINFFIFLFIKILLLVNDATLIAFAFTTTLEAIGSAFCLWWVNRSHGIKLSLKDIDLNYGWHLIIQSWPELFAGFAGLVFVRIDQIMLGNMIGNEAVGLYSVASKIAEAWYFVPAALVASTFPSIVIQRNVDKNLYLQKIQKLMIAVVIMSYIMIFLVTCFGSLIVGFLFGGNFKDSSYILLVLIWSGLFVSFGTVSGSWIVAEGKLKINLSRNLFGAFSNIIFNLILIPQYGANGAAFATVISLSLAYFFIDFLNPATRDMGLLKLKALFFIK